jgi:hypothetical protein
MLRAGEGKSAFSRSWHAALGGGIEELGAQGIRAAIIRVQVEPGPWSVLHMDKGSREGRLALAGLPVDEDHSWTDV